MASRTFLLLALAFAVVLLITSEVAAKELASENDSEMSDNGHGGYSKGGGGHGGHDGGHGGRGGHDGGRGGHGGGRGGHDNGGGHKGCKYGCCGGGRYSKGCRCCSTFEEATAYNKQTQN